MQNKRKRTSYLKAAGVVAATAVAGSIATDPDTGWYKSLDKPSWQPPSWLFPVAWTALYASIAVVSGKVLAATDSGSEADADRHEEYKKALLVNLALNAGWSFTFFRAKKLGLASVVAGALASSSSQLANLAGKQDPKLKLALTPYSAWTAFATALTTDIWRRNRD